MKKLSQEALARAREFIRTQARPLDWALFEHRFEGAGPEVVVGALTAFRNEDGGFGHALEPDVRTPDSSALATGIALGLLKELGYGPDQSLVRGAVAFLLDTFDARAQVWRVVPESTNRYPHAPWWHDENGSLARTFDGFLIIPRAQIVGLLHHFRDGLPANWLTPLTGRTVADVETIDMLGTGGGDDLAYALNLAETMAVPLTYRQRLAARIRAMVPKVVSRDPEAWATYCIQPLKVAPSPRSLAADLIWEEVQANLDYQIEQQSPEGTWDPVWNWGGTYPEAWAQARQEWRGQLTLETLTALQAYGRLAP
ncbi:MAG: hypothetical protein PVF47_00440 [Anaerolineae bacterium]|jgi:hypothetical protein